MNKTLNLWQLKIDNNLAPSWANHRSYYEDTCPVDFGKDFRQVRNSIIHVDYRRSIGNNRITLSDFYKKYHKYVMLLYYSGSEWCVKNEESINWGDITAFADLILKTGSAL